MRAALLAGLLTTSAIWSVHGAIYEDYHDLLAKYPDLEFDYIVVGGGNAGNVVANRLSEGGDHVLVLEAGPSDEECSKNHVIPTKIPLLGPGLLRKPSIDWHLETERMASLNYRRIPYGRGSILGGTSTTNFMIYNRGPKDDFDIYAKTDGASLWSWFNISKYTKKNVHIAPPTNPSIDYPHDKHLQFNEGVVNISFPTHLWPMDQKVLNLTEEFPLEFKRNKDVNSGNPLGIGWIQASVGNGQRSSSTSYLAPQYVGDRKNLNVLLHARVTKILHQEGKEGSLPVFRQVEFASHLYAQTRRIVKARKEVILSAGAFNTPQLLMLSGIGDKEELKDIPGIQKTVVHLPAVGKHASDHAMIANVVKVNTDETLETYIGEPKTLLANIIKWNGTHEGPLSFTVANQIGFLRLPDDDPILKKYGDPAPRIGNEEATSPHYELLFVPGLVSLTLTKKPEDASTYNTIFTVLKSPSSTGNVTLRTADPFDPPFINPNYLATEVDKHIMVKAVRTVKKIAESKSWAGYFDSYAEDGLANAHTDNQILDYARDSAVGLWHFSGSARMTNSSDMVEGVVNPDFRVKGTIGLRIVDASVFPFVPRAHPMGPIYLIAELASDIIKNGTKPSGLHQSTGQVPLMG